MTIRLRIPWIASFFLALFLLAPPAALATDPPGHIHLDDTRSLADQFGYAPVYRQNVVTFDPGNVPSIRSRGASEDDTSFVQRLEGGSWIRHDLLQTLRDAYPDFAGTISAGGFGTDRIDWDVEGRAYTILTIRMDDDGGFRNVLMASADACATWQVVELPFSESISPEEELPRGNIVSEHQGAQPLEGPPLIAAWNHLGPWRDQWSSLNEMRVVKPVWVDGALTLKPPVTASTIMLPQLSSAGGSSFAVTRGSKSFFVYSTVVPPGGRTTPTFAAVYDADTNTVSPGVLVGKSRPANDSHVTPAICADSTGTLHVVTGSHGFSFMYARSVVPLSTASWTKPVAVLDSGYRVKGTDADGAGKQAYVSLVCGLDDVLHVVSRQSRRRVDVHFVDGGGYNALVHQSLAPGQITWSAPDLIVVPPRTGYAQYYHKLTVDRLGRLFVSCSFLDNTLSASILRYRRFQRRMVLISEDGGHFWRFATTQDFLNGIPEAVQPPQTP